METERRDKVGRNWQTERDVTPANDVDPQAEGTGRQLEWLPDDEVRQCFPTAKYITVNVQCSETSIPFPLHDLHHSSPAVRSRLGNAFKFAFIVI